MLRRHSNSILTRLLVLVWAAAYAVLLVGLVLVAVVTPTGL